MMDLISPPEHRLTHVARSVPAVGLLLFLLAGAGTTLQTAWRHKLDLFPEPVNRGAFLDGRLTTDIPHALSTAPLPERAVRLQRGMAWEVLGDLGPRVRTGCKGWLFLADELRVYPQAEASMRNRVQTLARVRDALAGRGIDLLVITVPDKSRMEADQLCGQSRSPALEPRLRQWNSLLTQEDVENIDVSAAMRSAQLQGINPLFLHADMHWNEDGAAVAADAVAMVVSARVQAVPEQRYRTLTREEVERPGDLVHMAGLAQWPAHRPLPVDHVAISQVLALPRVDAGKGRDAQDLFGDGQIPNIALIGTSYSNTSNFAPFLERKLQARIGCFARDGGGFDGAARAYFASAAFRDSPPKLLLWEIPERVLEMPDGGAYGDLPTLARGSARPGNLHRT